MTTINELTGVVLRLPSGAYPLSGPTETYFLPLILEDGKAWQPFTTGIHWFYASSLISELCARRAHLCVDRRLTLRGRRTTPEAYLRHWRGALREAVDITLAPQLLRLRPIARFQFTAATVSKTSTCWERPAFKNLGEVIDVHRATLTAVPSGLQFAAPGRSTDEGVATADDNGRLQEADVLQLAIDLTQPHGPRDAWWVNDFLHPPKPHADPIHASIDFAPVQRAEEPVAEHTTARLAAQAVGPLFSTI